MKCRKCGQITTNPIFCNRSCATSFNNQKMPKKRKQQKHCKHCGTEILGRRTTCDDCNPSYVDWSQVTLLEVREKAAFQYSARVRQLARKIYRQSDKPKACLICGYDKHFEVCHKRPINDFSDATYISEINDLNNLVALCPNHHWELDHNYLTF
jgi:hypothetical protein